MAAAARLQQALRTAVRRVASAAATADASAPVGFVGLGAMGCRASRLQKLYLDPEVRTAGKAEADY